MEKQLNLPSEFYTYGYGDYVHNEHQGNAVAKFAERKNLDHKKLCPGDVYPVDWKEYQNGYNDARDHFLAIDLFVHDDLKSFARLCVDEDVSLDPGCCCCCETEVTIGGTQYSWDDFKLLYKFFKGKTPECEKSEHGRK